MKSETIGIVILVLIFSTFSGVNAFTPNLKKGEINSQLDGSWCQLVTYYVYLDDDNNVLDVNTGEPFGVKWPGKFEKLYSKFFNEYVITHPNNKNKWFFEEVCGCSQSRKIPNNPKIKKLHLALSICEVDGTAVDKFTIPFSCDDGLVTWESGSWFQKGHFYSRSVSGFSWDQSRV